TSLQVAASEITRHRGRARAVERGVSNQRAWIAAGPPERVVLHGHTVFALVAGDGNRAPIQISEARSIGVGDSHPSRKRCEVERVGSGRKKDRGRSGIRHVGDRVNLRVAAAEVDHCSVNGDGTWKICGDEKLFLALAAGAFTPEAAMTTGPAVHRVYFE